MATLRNGDLTLEIQYRDFEANWVRYDIWLLWRGEPVINDAILKRENAHWRKRGKGAIKADEHLECGILPLLRNVLETNKADEWESTDPDILLALYPHDTFPFLPPKWRIWNEPPDAKAERQRKEQERIANGPLPDDLIELMLFVDTYNFEGARYYSGVGLCFRLCPRRAELKRFYQELRSEYVAFRERWNVQGQNEEVEGPGYQPRPF